jgi:hypothetical protein
MNCGLFIPAVIVFAALIASRKVFNAYPPIGLLLQVRRPRFLKVTRSRFVLRSRARIRAYFKASMGPAPLERSEPELVKRRERKLDTGAEPDWSGWEIWLAARLKEHDEYLYDVIAEPVQEMIADELRGHS